MATNLITPANNKLTRWLIDLLCLLAGIITVLAFSPFDFSVLAIITPAILLACWLNTSARHAAWRGFLFGLGLFGAGVYWVYISIHSFGGVNIFLAGFLTFGFIAVLSIIPMLQGYVLNKLWQKTNLSKLLIAFPTSWTLFEWLRSWLFTGFPWLDLGTSQVNSLLAGFAPIVGTYGTTFIATFCAGLIVTIFITNKMSRYLACICLIAIGFSGWALSHVDWTTAKGKPITVSLVQGNVSQTIKWNPAWVIKNIKRYQQLTHWHSQLIVWPENAIPLPLPYATTIIDELNLKAKQHHSTLITGIPLPAGENFYNGLLALGTSQGIYKKRHLVPFGEYVPLASMLRGLIGFFDLPMSSFIPGPQQQPLIRFNNKIPLAVYICYEIAYSNLVDTDLPKAQLLITISDDAWFGQSIAAWQHLQIGQMQALSTGRDLLFSTNNGVTAIINNHGKIIKTAPRFKPLVLTGKVQPRVGSTPWTLLTNWPIIIILMILFLIGLFFRNTKK